MYSYTGETERERERERERETVRERDRQTVRQTDRQTERQRQTETERDRERQPCNLDYRSNLDNSTAHKIDQQVSVGYSKLMFAAIQHDLSCLQVPAVSQDTQEIIDGLA